MTRPANMNEPRKLAGLEEVAGFYDGFILDIWGVLHDGVKPLPDTVATLEALKEAKRIVWLLSNAPRRSHAVAGHLASIGIARDLYDGILTSGEATHLAMRDIYLEKWGRRCFHLGTERDHSLFEGLDITLVGAPEEADFVINSGVYDSDSAAAADSEPLLRRCADRGLPMICANPDKVVHVEDKLVLCPGTFAELYERMDGQVTYFGKPHRAVYSACLQAIGVRRILAVGDGMATDILGAVGAGIDAALVISGIHRDALSGTAGGFSEENRLLGFLKGYPYQPHYLLQRFSW